MNFKAKLRNEERSKIIEAIQMGINATPGGLEGENISARILNTLESNRDVQQAVADLSSPYNAMGPEYHVGNLVRNRNLVNEFSYIRGGLVNVLRAYLIFKSDGFNAVDRYFHTH